MDYPKYEERTEIVGDYIVFGTVEYDQYGCDNPLKTMDSGEIHCGDKRESFGEPSSFRAALGYDPEYGTEYLDISDYQLPAATLVVLALKEDEAREVLTECIENGWITPSEVDDQLMAKGERPLESHDEVPVESLPLSVVQATIMFHAHEGVRQTYWKTSTTLSGPIEELAVKLKKNAIEARAYGDKYAIPLKIARYQDTQITVEADKSFLEMQERDGLWIPGKAMREEFDALPYPEALERCREFAKSDSQMVTDWANGNVFIVEVKAYRLQHDEDGEPIEDLDEYEGEEAEWEENCHGYFGDEDAMAGFNEFFASAKAHVEGLQAAEQPAASPSP